MSERVFIPVKQEEDTFLWRQKRLSSPLFVPRDARVRITYLSYSANINFVVTLLVQLPTGETLLRHEKIQTGAAGLQNDFLLPEQNSDFYILGASAATPLGVADVFVKAQIEYSYAVGGGDFYKLVFLYGWIENGHGPSYIDGNMVGEPFLYRSVVITNPAAGNEISIFPSNGAWEVVSLRYRFTTSATVATRTVKIFGKDAAGNIFFQLDSTYDQLANQLTYCSLFVGAGVRSRNNILDTINSPLPPMRLMPGFSIATSTANLQIGDQFDFITILVRERPIL